MANARNTAPRAGGAGGADYCGITEGQPPHHPPAAFPIGSQEFVTMLTDCQSEVVVGSLAITKSRHVIKQLIAYPLTFLAAIWAGAAAQFLCFAALASLRRRVGLFETFFSDVLNGLTVALVAYLIFSWLKLTPGWILLVLAIAVLWNDYRRMRTRPAIRLQILHLVGDLSGFAIVAWFVV